MQARISGMTATNLRLTLISSMVLLLVAFAGSFLFLRNQLDAYAVQVKQDNSEADASNDDVARLQQLKQELQNDKVAVTRAKNIVADSQSYQYQNQIINDINQYANTSGVIITSFTFNSDGDVKAVPTTPVSPLTAPPAGLKTTSAVVSIKNPVDYKAIMRFIHSIELNLTKMQLAGVSLSKGTSSTDVTVNPITIEVYTR